MFWENIREEEFKNAVEKCSKLCVITMGCIEKHGQHLPRADEFSKEGIRIANHWYPGSPNCYNGAPAHGTTQTIGLAMKKLCVERMARVFKLIKESDDILAIARMDRAQKLM